MSRARRALVSVLLAVASAAPVAHANTTGHQCASGPAVTGARRAVPPVGYASCMSVRPGDMLYATLDGGSSSCVAGFLYSDRRGDAYIATGGNCAPPWEFAEPITTWKRGRGPVALDARNGKRIGEWAFRVVEGDVSMSLVRLDAGVPFDPQLCQYGGPTALTTDVSSDPVQLVMVGPLAGLTESDFYFGRSNGSMSRPALAHGGLYDRDVILVQGGSLTESGMPVVTADGEAVGLADFYVVRERGAAGYDAGLVVTRLARPIAIAEKVMRTRLTLLTAPLT